jgi:hypothetical protein
VRRGPRSPWVLGDERQDADDRVEGEAVEKIMWLVLGVTVIATSLRAGRSDRARLVARVALGSLFLFFGAMVNAVYLITVPESFAAFGDMSQFVFVRDTWSALVAPHLWLFIGLLIVGEATAGLLVLAGGRRTDVGLALLIPFHVGLLFFGWWLWLYALPMLGSLVLLLRAQRRARARPGPRAVEPAATRQPR